MVREITPWLDDARSAERLASACATSAGVRIGLLERLDEFGQASDLLSAVWGGDAHKMAPDLLIALRHAGNYVAAAWAGERMSGAVVGFLAATDDEIYLHSHVLGVLPEARGRNVGFALKQHQRAWALQHGIGRVAWTTDPLVRKNVYFNLTKLGAEADAYISNLYGPMHDGLNAGDESDRFSLSWRLGAERVVLAAKGKLPDPDIEASREESSVVLAVDEGDRPRVADLSGERLLIQIPEDIVALRRRDAGLAREWRSALRETLGAGMRAGYVVEGFAPSGWYAARRGSAAAPRPGRVRVGRGAS